MFYRFEDRWFWWLLYKLKAILFSTSDVILEEELDQQHTVTLHQVKKQHKSIIKKEKLNVSEEASLKISFRFNSCIKIGYQANNDVLEHR